MKTPSAAESLVLNVAWRETFWRPLSLLVKFFVTGGFSSLDVVLPFKVLVNIATQKLFYFAWEDCMWPSLKTDCLPGHVHLLRSHYNQMGLVSIYH